jgi:hypothetical protein
MITYQRWICPASSPRKQAYQDVFLPKWCQQTAPHHHELTSETAKVLLVKGAPSILNQSAQTSVSK